MTYNPSLSPQKHKNLHQYIKSSHPHLVSHPHLLKLSSSPEIITVLVFHNLLTTNIVCFRNPKSKFRNVLIPVPPPISIPVLPYPVLVVLAPNTDRQANRLSRGGTSRPRRFPPPDIAATTPLGYRSSAPCRAGSRWPIGQAKLHGPSGWEKASRWGGEQMKKCVQRLPRPGLVLRYSANRSLLSQQRYTPRFARWAQRPAIGLS